MLIGTTGLYFVHVLLLFPLIHFQMHRQKRLNGCKSYFSFMFNQSDFQSGVADFRFHRSKYSHVFMIKVVHPQAFKTTLFNKSSLIFPMN